MAFRMKEYAIVGRPAHIYCTTQGGADVTVVDAFFSRPQRHILFEWDRRAAGQTTCLLPLGERGLTWDFL